MNRALAIKNYKEGGNNYVLKGNAKNKWAGFQQTIISQLQKSFEDNFNIVVWTDEQNDYDYYCIPYKAIKHLFIEEHKTTGKYPKRWTAIILDQRFLMHSNNKLSVDISKYYALPFFTKTIVEINEDFYIEDLKREVNIRLHQSKFREGVLKNFKYQCALTGIEESSLLIASHIIPWSHKKEFRGDISNGICLYVEYDALFDKGYISFTNDLQTIVTSKQSSFSKSLTSKLIEINGKYLKSPVNKKLNTTYLEYHRKEIFEKKYLEFNGL